MDTNIEHKKPLYCEINGFRFPVNIKSANEIQSIIEHNSTVEFDVIINSRPKTGTQWMSQIVYLITNNGIPIENGLPLKVYEFYYYSDEDINKNSLHIMLTHLPIRLLKNTDKTKIIFLLRNPKDVVVSFYHFLQNIRGVHWDRTFDEFFKLWLNGEVPYGDYFDSCLEWLSYRNDPNILLVIYENLIRDTREEITRIAGFIDEKYSEKLMANNYDNSFMENVLKHCSIEHMRSQISYQPYHVRKGIIGDWRNYLSKEQSDIIDNKVNEKFSETGLAEVWKNDMIWKNL